MAEQARILVVDDNEDMANGVAMLLHELPAQATVAFSAEQGLERLGEHAFDLVMTDVRMPTMNGLEFLDGIREQWPAVKVVMMTAFGAIDSAVEAIKRGASEYVTKPFDNQALLAVVRKVLAEGALDPERDLAKVVGDVAALVSPDDLLPSLDRALEFLRVAAGADDCELFLCEPDGGDLLLSACQGPDRDVLEERFRFEWGTGYPGIVAETGVPLTTQALADDPRYLRSAVVERGLTSGVCVPLPNLGGVLGSLNVFSRSADYPVELAVDMLTQVATPISNAIRAGLASLRQFIDAVCTDGDQVPSEATLQALLRYIQNMAGARSGTLALIDPKSGRPTRVVDSGAVRHLCTEAEAGHWEACPYLPHGHGHAPERGRRNWPDPCRTLPVRAVSPCCLPLVAHNRLNGLAVLDFGRSGPLHATSKLVPLLVMAQQAAIRLRAHHEGLPLDEATSSQPANTVSVEAYQLSVRCFGSFELFVGPAPIPVGAFSRSKAVALLKLLILNRGRPVPRDVLIEQLWPNATPKSGANRLHGVLHALRSVIEPYRSERRWIFATNQADLYRFDLKSPHQVDLFEFDHNLAMARKAQRQNRPVAERIAFLDKAVELHRGDLFADDPYAPWCQDERTELRERYLEALRSLAQLHARQDAYDPAIDALQRALRCDPLREDMHQALIRVLIGAGRRSDALVQYETCVQLLTDELGVAPLESTLQLRERLAADS